MIFQDLHHYAKSDAIFVDFQNGRQIFQFFVKFRRFFRNLQNFSDFDRSDAKIAVFQRYVKKQIAEILLQIS